MSAASNPFPVILGMTVDEIVTLFEFPELPTTKDKPTYAHTIDVRNKMYRNLVAVESSFGGGDCGHLGILMPTEPYRTKAGVDWIVPASDPDMVPNLSQAGDDAAKKKETQRFFLARNRHQDSEDSDDTHAQDAPQGLP